jgi:hypothetical protein
MIFHNKYIMQQDFIIIFIYKNFVFLQKRLFLMENYWKDEGSALYSIDDDLRNYLDQDGGNID